MHNSASGGAGSNNDLWKTGWTRIVEGSLSLNDTALLTSSISNAPSLSLSNLRAGRLVFKFLVERKTLSPSLKIGPSILRLLLC